MLQQTQAARVVSVYEAFIRRFPSVTSLAAASRRDVLRAWDGLGYHRRAVALSEGARIVVRDQDGHLPCDPAALRRLPGVGPYTSAAVASIAFGVPIAAVDTNVRRIVARLHLGVEADDASPRDVAEIANAWLDPRDPGRWNQALMDLGREVCRPRPRCDACPLAAECRFVAAGLPLRPARRKQDSFRGSTREVRGAIVRALRAHESLSIGRLVAETGFARERVVPAVSALAGEGIVAAGPAAVAESPRGRVWLAE